MWTKCTWPIWNTSSLPPGLPPISNMFPLPCISERVLRFVSLVMWLLFLSFFFKFSLSLREGVCMRVCVFFFNLSACDANLYGFWNRIQTMPFLRNFILTPTPWHNFTTVWQPIIDKHIPVRIPEVAHPSLKHKSEFGVWGLRWHHSLLRMVRVLLGWRLRAAPLGWV